MKARTLEIWIAVCQSLALGLLGFTVTNLLLAFDEGLWSLSLGPLAAAVAVGFGIPAFRAFDRWDARRQRP